MLNGDAAMKRNWRRTADAPKLKWKRRGRRPGRLRPARRVGAARRTGAVLDAVEQEFGVADECGCAD